MANSRTQLGPDRRRRLLCGPLVRHIGSESAVVWAEANVPTEAEVVLFSGRRIRRRQPMQGFQIGDRHYLIVALERLRPSTWYEYEIRRVGAASGELPLWPRRLDEQPRPRSTFRTLPLGPGAPLSVAYLSCRGMQPYDDQGDAADPSGGVDALKLYARRALRDYRFRRLRWPHLLLLMGDQIYADELSPQMHERFDEAHRRANLPTGTAVTFDEYAQLYNEAWEDPDVRWLLSCVPSFMIFDDHEVIDDWNISASWVEEKQDTNWWLTKFEAGLLAYWVYQGAGNLAPTEWSSDERTRTMLPHPRARRVDVTSRMRSLFRGYASGSRRAHWSYSVAAGPARIVVADNRSRRDVLARKMMDDDEWAFFTGMVRAAREPMLLIVFSLPLLLPDAIHELESSSEASGEFPWNLDPATVVVDALTGARRKVQEEPDLEHWPAFSRSFEDMIGFLEEICGAGRRRVFILSGDVHFSYNMKGELLKVPGAAIYQLVSSPSRNRLQGKKAVLVQTLSTPVGRAAVELGRLIAGAHGVAGFVPPTPQTALQKARLRWDFVETGRGHLWIGNFIATLTMMGRVVDVAYQQALRDPSVPDDGKTYPGRRLISRAGFRVT